ncbi:MAG: CDP-alcohol phosphatidyltransferase family protein [Myxococcota bacterium]
MEAPSSAPRCILFFPSVAPADRIPIFGLSAVERTVLSLRRAGVRSFALLGDPEACRQAAARLASGPCARARVRVRQGLGGLAEEPCLVARGDVYYDRRLLWRFVDETEGERETRLALDPRPEALAGRPGASCVWLHPGGGVRRAGRGLVAADALLTGLGLANPSFARALEAAEPDGVAFERAVNRVAEREPVATWEVREPWQPLTTSSDANAVRRKLLAGAVALGDGIVARHLNRPISRRITERLVSRDVKPWQISVVSFLGTVAAGLAFAIGHAATGGLLAQLASVLDCVDGEVARIRYQDSPFGGVYDALLDRVGEAAVVGGMTLYAWAMGAGNSAVALGFAALAGSSLSMLVKEKYTTQFQRPYRVDEEGRWRWMLMGRDGRLFLALIAGLTGYVEAVLAYLAVGTHLQAGIRIYRMRGEVARA